MRELHGVLRVGDWLTQNYLKHQTVLFDHFYSVGLERFRGRCETREEQGVVADLDFLESCGVLHELPKSALKGSAFPYVFALGLDTETFIDELNDGLVREVACNLPSAEHDVVGVLSDCLPRKLPETVSATGRTGSGLETILWAAVRTLPFPDHQCSWQDILDFKAEMHDKQWHFRRFLHTLSTKQQTESEARDEIEWMVNEYTKAMALHHLKASQSFVDVFVITPLEIIENLVKFNWSKIAKGALQVQKRKVELMEAEARAPGRECAYVFDARKRFG